MSQVNLLPPEAREKLQGRRLTFGIIGVGAALVAIVLFFWLLKGSELAGVQLSIQAQTAKNGDLQGQIDELTDAVTLSDELDQSTAISLGALANEISWSSVLRDVQLVIPDGVGLTSLSGNISGPSRSDTVSVVIGELSFSGDAAGPTGAQRIARWLGQQNTIGGWLNPWMSSMTETSEYSGQYSFSSTVDLTIDARTARGQGPAVVPEPPKNAALESPSPGA